MKKTRSMKPKNKGAERPREDRAASMIGMARRAGKAAGGGFSVETAIRQGNAFLIILAEDASGNTKKKFENMAAWHNVPIRQFLPKEKLGHCIGKEERSVLAILDEGLAREIERILNGE